MRIIPIKVANFQSFYNFFNLSMIKYLVCVFLIISGFTVQAQHPFLQNLQKFCGKSFEGTVAFPKDGKDPFAGKRLVIHFLKCDSNEVSIPFYVGEDRSRTWVLTNDSSGLLLKHDHRHKDGTPDSITMYGGYAAPSQRSWIQFFPADSYTAKLIPPAATNEWCMLLSEDRKTFSYILHRNGEPRFRADFDLSKPL